MYEFNQGLAQHNGKNIDILGVVINHIYPKFTPLLGSVVVAAPGLWLFLLDGAHHNFIIFQPHLYVGKISKPPFMK